MVAVAGCVAQAEGEEIIRRAPVVDLVVGPQSYHRLPELLARVARGEAVVDTEFPVEDKFDALKAPTAQATRARGVSAFVTVQEGCDKFCTFCVVPYTRGAEVSRPVAKIVAEIERLADAGVREVTLIGQNVNAYHGDGPDGRAWTLGRLLHRIAEVPGIARLRYTTSHPCDMDDEPDRGAPRPAGADAVPAPAGAVGLRPHPRGHEPPAHARRLSRRASRACARRGRTSRSRPISSSASRARARTISRATLALVDEVGYAGAFSFKYSPRPGTPAAEHGGPGSGGVKSERLQRLQQADRPAAARLQCALRRPHLRRAVREAGPASWPDRGPLAISAAGAGHGAAALDRQTSHR